MSALAAPQQKQEKEQELAHPPQDDLPSSSPASPVLAVCTVDLDNDENSTPNINDDTKQQENGKEEDTLNKQRAEKDKKKQEKDQQTLESVLESCRIARDDAFKKAAYDDEKTITSLFSGLEAATKKVSELSPPPFNACWAAMGTLFSLVSRAISAKIHCRELALRILSLQSVISKIRGGGGGGVSSAGERKPKNNQGDDDNDNDNVVVTYSNNELAERLAKCIGQCNALMSKLSPPEGKPGESFLTRAARWINKKRLELSATPDQFKQCHADITQIMGDFVAERAATREDFGSHFHVEEFSNKALEQIAHTMRGELEGLNNDMEKNFDKISHEIGRSTEELRDDLQTMRTGLVALVEKFDPKKLTELFAKIMRTQDGEIDRNSLVKVSPTATERCFFSSSSSSSSLNSSHDNDSECPLARGRHSTVFKVRRGDNTRALKEFVAAGPDSHARVASEYENLRRVAHDNVVTVYGFMTTPVPALLLELADKPLMAAAQSASNWQKLSYTLDLLSGMRAIHAQGLVHGQIDIDNMLVFGPRAKFIHFSSASCRRDGDGGKNSGDHPLDRSWPYLPPEFFSPSSGGGVGGVYDELCDAYGLGVALFELWSEGRAFPTYIPASHAAPPDPSHVEHFRQEIPKGTRPVGNVVKDSPEFVLNQIINSNRTTTTTQQQASNVGNSNNNNSGDGIPLVIAILIYNLWAHDRLKRPSLDRVSRSLAELRSRHGEKVFTLPERDLPSDLQQQQVASSTSAGRCDNIRVTDPNVKVATLSESELVEYLQFKNINAFYVGHMLEKKLRGADFVRAKSLADLGFTEDFLRSIPSVARDRFEQLQQEVHNREWGSDAAALQQQQQQQNRKSLVEPIDFWKRYHELRRRASRNNETPAGVAAAAAAAVSTTTTERDVDASSADPVQLLSNYLIMNDQKVNRVAKAWFFLGQELLLSSGSSSSGGGRGAAGSQQHNNHNNTRTVWIRNVVVNPQKCFVLALEHFKYDDEREEEHRLVEEAMTASTKKLGADDNDDDDQQKLKQESNDSKSAHVLRLREESFVLQPRDLAAMWTSLGSFLVADENNSHNNNNNNNNTAAAVITVASEAVTKRGCFRKALEHDDKYALAWALLGNDMLTLLRRATSSSSSSSSTSQTSQASTTKQQEEHQQPHFTFKGKSYTPTALLQEALRIDNKCSMAWYGLGMALRSSSSSESTKVTIDGISHDARSCFVQSVSCSSSSSSADTASASGAVMNVDAGGEAWIALGDLVAHNPAEPMGPKQETVAVAGKMYTRVACYSNALFDPKVKARAYLRLTQSPVKGGAIFVLGKGGRGGKACKPLDVCAASLEYDSSVGETWAQAARLLLAAELEWKEKMQNQEQQQQSTDDDVPKLKLSGAAGAAKKTHYTSSECLLKAVQKDEFNPDILMLCLEVHNNKTKATPASSSSIAMHPEEELLLNTQIKVTDALCRILASSQAHARDVTLWWDLVSRFDPTRTHCKLSVVCPPLPVVLSSSSGGAAATGTTTTTTTTSAPVLMSLSDICRHCILSQQPKHRGAWCVVWFQTVATMGAADGDDDDDDDGDESNNENDIKLFDIAKKAVEADLMSAPAWFALGSSLMWKTQQDQQQYISPKIRARTAIECFQKFFECLPLAPTTTTAVHQHHAFSRRNSKLQALAWHRLGAALRKKIVDDGASRDDVETFASTTSPLQCEINAVDLDSTCAEAWLAIGNHLLEQVVIATNSSSNNSNNGQQQQQQHKQQQQQQQVAHMKDGTTKPSHECFKLCLEHQQHLLSVNATSFADGGGEDSLLVAAEAWCSLGIAMGMNNMSRCVVGGQEEVESQQCFVNAIKMSMLPVARRRPATAQQHSDAKRIRAMAFFRLAVFLDEHHSSIKTIKVPSSTTADHKNAAVAEESADIITCLNHALSLEPYLAEAYLLLGYRAWRSNVVFRNNQPVNPCDMLAKALSYSLSTNIATPPQNNKNDNNAAADQHQHQHQHQRTSKKYESFMRLSEKGLGKAWALAAIVLESMSLQLKQNYIEVPKGSTPRLNKIDCWKRALAHDPVGIPRAWYEVAADAVCNEKTLEITLLAVSRRKSETSTTTSSSLSLSYSPSSCFTTTSALPMNSVYMCLLKALELAGEPTKSVRERTLRCLGAVPLHCWYLFCRAFEHKQQQQQQHATATTAGSSTQNQNNNKLVTIREKDFSYAELLEHTLTGQRQLDPIELAKQAKHQLGSSSRPAQLSKKDEALLWHRLGKVLVQRQKEHELDLQQSRAVVNRAKYTETECFAQAVSVNNHYRDGWVELHKVLDEASSAKAKLLMKHYAKEVTVLVGQSETKVDRAYCETELKNLAQQAQQQEQDVFEG